MTTEPEAIVQIKAALAAGPTDGPWIAAGPSFGMALPKYLNEVVVNREGDDIYLVCVCPLVLDGDQESSVTMDYISIVNPAAMRDVLDHIAAQDAEISRLREALLRSKSLISDVYSMLPEQAIAARQVIDKRTGAWFVFGVDREALTTKEPS